MTTAADLARFAAALADGLTELGAAVDHDLRARFRSLQREADAWAAANDPASGWSAFGDWLVRRATAEVAANHAFLCARAGELAAALGVEVALPHASGHVAPALAAGPQRPGGGTLGFSALRGACGGVITVGLLAGLAGLAIAVPASIAVGAVFGVKALADDRAKHLAHRRAEAKVAIQRCLDEVVFQSANVSRSTVREVQRRLRAAGGLPGAEPDRAGTVPADRRPTSPGTAVDTAALRFVTADARASRRRRLLTTVAAAALAAVVAAALLTGIGRPSSTASADPKPTTTTTTAAPAPAPTDRDAALEGEARGFLSRLVAATRDGDLTVLFDGLHPEVLTRYGADACVAYLGSVTVFPVDLAVRDVGPAAPWPWITDGLGTTLAEVVAVEVSRVDASQTIVQEIHLVRTADGLRWLTDCGEPLPIR